MRSDERRRHCLNPMETLKRFTIALALIASAAVVAQAQKTKPKETPAPAAPVADDSHVRASAAYAEVLLRKTELSATLDALLEEYTDNYPKVIETRLQLESITADMERLRAVKPEAAGRLTSALGRLIVRRSELYAEYRTTSGQYDSANPMVKRAKKAYESFSKSIDDILK